MERGSERLLVHLQRRRRAARGAPGSACGPLAVGRLASAHSFGWRRLRSSLGLPQPHAIRVPALAPYARRCRRGMLRIGLRCSLEWRPCHRRGVAREGPADERAAVCEGAGPRRQPRGWKWPGPHPVCPGALEVRALGDGLPVVHGGSGLLRDFSRGLGSEPGNAIERFGFVVSVERGPFSTPRSMLAGAAEVWPTNFNDDVVPRWGLLLRPNDRCKLGSRPEHGSRR
mmetsp:Transcript_125363/g.360141  ORF Transcript_125363/g.360141 Transcript_125363/m.360141 type:complete len:228 (-) Transcript_125363:453-1136(-)